MGGEKITNLNEESSKLFLYREKVREKENGSQHNFFFYLRGEKKKKEKNLPIPLTGEKEKVVGGGKKRSAYSKTFSSGRKGEGGKSFRSFNTRQKMRCSGGKRRVACLCPRHKGKRS